jgi:hypothetical protein
VTLSIAAFAIVWRLLASDPTPAPSPTPAATATIGTDYAGQVLDVERGYIVFASGDALRLAADVRFVDAQTGLLRPESIQPGQYAAVTIDATGLVTSVRIADAPIGSAKPESQIPRQFIAQASPAFPNPDLIPPPKTYPVSKLSPREGITITVEVPPETPFSDDVYIATDTSGWNPQAVKMQRIDGQHFRVEMDVTPGTQFRYLFTRGSWPTVESDDAGLRRKPRILVAQGAVSLVVDASVHRWVDLP